MYTSLSQFKIGDALIPLKTLIMGDGDIGFIKGREYIIRGFEDGGVVFKSELTVSHFMSVDDLNKWKFVRKEKVPKLYKVLYANNL